MAVDPSVAGREYVPEPYEVSREKIREFAESIGDGNPVYYLPAAARDRGHADIVAPPTFVMIPVMRGLDLLMADLGIEWARVVHVDQKFAYARAAVIGDRLDVRTILEGVRTIAGNDLFSIRCEVRGASGDDLCTATATVLVLPEEGSDA